MLTPPEIARSLLAAGESKARLPFGKMLLLAILAGAYIALAGVGATAAAVTVESGSLARLLSACVFPAGLSMVILAGSELFTGNCLLVIPLLEGEVKFSGVLKNWVFVYLGNFVGSSILAFLVAFGHSPSLLDKGLLDVVMSVAAGKVALSFGDAVFRGIVCNMMVCLAVWMSFAGKTVASKIAGLYFPIMIFVMAGFEHSIANMYYLMVGIFSNSIYGVGNTAVNLGAALTKNLLPVTLGNLIGGAAIGIVYWYLYLKGTKKD